MRIRLKRFNYRYAEEILNSRHEIKKEIENILTNPCIDLSSLSRPDFNRILKEMFEEKGWMPEAPVFDAESTEKPRMDFLKDRIGVEVGFGHGSFLGIDLLKLQAASYSGLDKIDVGVYIATTKHFQKVMKKEYGQNWTGSLSYEKIIGYLPHFKSAIQVPVYVIGIDL